MNEQLSLFNIVIEYPTNTAELPKVAPPKSKPTTPILTKSKPTTPILTKSKPTTPILNVPTVDEIVKAIGKASYRTSRSKLVEDIFECGALPSQTWLIKGSSANVKNATLR